MFSEFELVGGRPNLSFTQSIPVAVMECRNVKTGRCPFRRAFKVLRLEPYVHPSKCLEALGLQETTEAGTPSSE